MEIKKEAITNVIAGTKVTYKPTMRKIVAEGKDKKVITLSLTGAGAIKYDDKKKKGEGIEAAKVFLKEMNQAGVFKNKDGGKEFLKISSVGIIPAKQNPNGSINIKALSRKSAACLESLFSAIKGIDDSYINLALKLHEAEESEYWRDWGCDSMKHFIDTKLKIDYRVAHEFIRIAKACKISGITKQQITGIGWSKMKEIAGKLMENPKQAQKWLELAKSKSHRELAQAVRSTTKAIDARAECLRLSYSFTANEGRLVSDALDKAIDEINDDSAKAAQNGMLHICQDWLRLRESEGSMATVEDWINYINKTFGVKLSADVPTEDEEVPKKQKGKSELDGILED